MTCSELTDHLDDYVDGSLAADLASRLEVHVESCEPCRELIARERRLRDALRAYGDASMPSPEAGFYDQALIRAAHLGRQKEHKHSWFKGFGSAMAAGLALWIIAGVLMTPRDGDDALPAIPAVTMALEEPRTVNLVFSSAQDLDQATLTVSLPDGVELAGFAGQREISWMTSLSAGRNVLPLKLIATSPRGGELLATLQHEDDDKTFRLQVNVI